MKQLFFVIIPLLLMINADGMESKQNDHRDLKHAPNIFYVERPAIHADEQFSSFLFNALNIQSCLAAERSTKEDFIKHILNQKLFPQEDFAHFQNLVKAFAKNDNIELQRPFEEPFKMKPLAEKFMIKNLSYISYRNMTSSIRRTFLAHTFKQKLKNPYSAIFLICKFETEAMLVALVNFAANGYVPLMFIIDPRNCLQKFPQEYQEIISFLHAAYGKQNSLSKPEKTCTDWKTTPLHTNFSCIKDIQYSYDGIKMVILGEHANQAEVHDASTGKLICTLKHQDEILCATFHPLSDVLITGSKDGTAKIWDAQSGECISTLKTKKQWHKKIPVTAIACSRTGNILTGLARKGSILWSHDRGKWNIHVPLYQRKAHGAVTAQSFNENYDTVLIGTSTGLVHSYQLDASKTWLDLEQFKYGEPIKQICTSDNGNLVTIISKSENNDMHFASLKINKNTELVEFVPRELIFHKTHADECKKAPILAYNAYGTKILFFADHVFEIDLRTSTNKVYRTVLHKQNTHIRHAVYNNLGTRLLMADGADMLSFWKYTKGKWIREHKIKQPAGSICFAVLNPIDHKSFVTATPNNGVVTLWMPVKEKKITVSTNTGIKKELKRKSTEIKHAKTTKKVKQENKEPLSAQVDEFHRFLKKNGKDLDKVHNFLNQFNPQAVNALGKKQSTPLVLAVIYCKSEVIDHLIALGADVNATCKQNVTALHVAAGLGNFENVKCLVAYNAKIEAQTATGTTAETTAREAGHTEIANYLANQMEI